MRFRDKRIETKKPPRRQKTDDGLPFVIANKGELDDSGQKQIDQFGIITLIKNNLIFLAVSTDRLSASFSRCAAEKPARFFSCCRVFASTEFISILSLSAIYHDELSWFKPGRSI